MKITLPRYAGSSAEIRAVDVLGRPVYRHRFAPFAYLHTFDVRDWVPGVYHVVLLDGGRWPAAARVVVAR